MKLQPILEGILREEEDKKTISALDQAMATSFKTMGTELEANKVEQSDGKLNESLGVLAILGVILAAPKLVELLAKGFSAIINTFKKLFKPNQAKTEQEQESVAHTIIEFTHKWHKSYIKGLKWIFKVSGVFKKANIEGEANQLKATEAVYYVFIAALAVWSGVGAVGAFKAAIAGAANGGSFSLAAFEAAMATIKSAEVSEFSSKLGLKAA